MLNELSLSFRLLQDLSELFEITNQPLSVSSRYDITCLLI